MPAPPELIVQATAENLATDVAVRVVSTLARAQQTRGRAALALTAGSIMEKVWSAIAATASREAVDWARVDVFWADERYVPADSADRNDAPANRLLFSHSPFTAARLFPMPASDGPFADLDRAAAGYAEQLSAARRPDDPHELPHFDVLLLGVGPDGHCASLFPEHPSAYDDSGPVIAVRNSPKPPPLRISLSFEGLAAANEIWFVASGAGKSRAVALALSGAGRVQVPAAGPRGRLRTLWLVDRDAAAGLPRRPDGQPVL
ncbi:MAG TPA: 6-phosphogluconolactonase [Jatrophihabitans sp.]|jgi:6-phosphogluconolactonase|uniref:6-phosphogluconolactonase n=1 Tax=Jatrophihabitans sp. TaxID=1932789 RepID=UPI002F098DE9